MKYLLIKVLIILYLVGLVYPNENQYDHTPFRKLRGRSGGRSGSSGGYGRSGYYSGYVSSKYGVKYTSVNTYLRNGRTYEPLYTYYLPVGYVSVIGYYSILHNKIYYDGYGYNFYYGAFAYYETSPNDTNYNEIITGILTIICLFGCFTF